MNEITAYLDRERENIRVAELLATENSPDIAASRAYYAMFYIAEALLLSRGLTYSSHAAVIAAYGKEFARHKALDPKFHRYLIDSQDTRQLGDYGVEAHVPVAEATATIRRAREFLEAAESYLGIK